ncbi:MAG TPA: ankyrin repeat domain-containing protein [Rickettsia endosymbiont of Omalisus fontisbellaquei]|nr:ankyrin repeat domain-containing protein [Rickettsia endosymbiont of Omalisus fontisbellaquei]
MNEQEELLIEAIQDSDLKKVQKLLQAGVNPNTLDEDDNPCIYSAISNKNLDIVNALLDYGANPNALDEAGNHIILKAIATKKLGILNALLDKGADPNFQPPGKNPILLKAINSNNLDMFNALINKGANPNALDLEGNPIILRAIKSEKVKMVKALLDKGVYVNQVDKDGTPILFSAIKTKDLDTIRSLIDKNADIELTNKNGDTALDILLEHKGNVDIALLFIENAKEQTVEKILNLKNSNGETLLHLAAQQGKKEVFDKCLDYYLKSNHTVNITDKTGNTPLYWSKLLGHTKISEILTKHAEELNDTAYTRITKTERFEDLPPIPKIVLSYNSQVGGEVANEAKNKLIYQGGDLEYIDYRKIVPESANTEKNINKEVINEARKKAKELLADKDALVIPGNNFSVDPEVAKQFGGEVTLEDGKFDFARSLAETIMVEVAIEKGMPIMGICGGHQVINTYLKGKIADMPYHKHDSMIIEPTSELASIIKRNSTQKEILEQSFWGSHNNIVKEVGGKDRLIDKKELLKVTATTKHGEIEATESQFGAPIRTFQFHPEVSERKLTYSVEEMIRDKKIFASFVQSAQTFANKKNLGVNIKSEVPKQKNFRAMISEQRKEQPTARSR